MLDWLTPQIIVGVLGGGGLAALLGLMGTRVKAASDEKAAKIAARDPGWHAFVEEIREEYADQKAWLEKRIESQDRRIEEMKADLSRTKASVDRLDRLYRAALDVIRDFMRRHPLSDVVVPDEIRKDL